MSLRYKALIAAVLLVALVTGVLVWRAGDSYEQAERARISSQLRQDAANLNSVLKGKLEVVGETLKFAAQTSELVRLVGGSDKLGQNFDTFAREWAEAAGADIAIAAIDTFMAEDREANVLHRGEEISTVGIFVRPAFTLDRAPLLADAELNARLLRAFREADKSMAEKRKLGKARAARPVPLVMGIDGRVYLCVITPLYDSLQDFTVVGVGAGLIEVSSAWLKQNFQVAGGSESSGVDKVVHVGGKPTAATWDSMDESAMVFADSAQQTDVFPFDLPSTGDRYLGLRAEFDPALAPPDLQHRPGFIPFKNLDKELEPLARLRQDISLLA
jgi:hypothetical protein